MKPSKLAMQLYEFYGSFLDNLWLLAGKMLWPNPDRERN
jgi:hypothetical protein